ncbi:Tad domain-containing protein [Ornithinimicrobium flavum]|uniref:Tad domain-containing protein n=1 Tax=Ornithinimicrobium flavum TaxID=1288636 RepID=UPI00106F0C91|nr:Tad domain-containing protein [Ornithinimicrobium flavum]
MTGVDRLVRALRSGGDRGSIMPMIPVMALSLLLIAGLVIDASRQLNARSQAVAYAEEAARAGAQAVEPALPVALDRAEATTLVGEYCDRVLSQPRVRSCAITGFEPAPTGPPRPLVVVVRVETQIPATLLGMVGVRTLSAAGEGRAEPVEGDLLAPDPVAPPEQP